MLNRIKSKIAELVKGDSGNLEELRELVNEYQENEDTGELVVILVDAHHELVKRWNPEQAYNLLFMAASLSPDDMDMKRLGAKLLDDYLWNYPIAKQVLEDLASREPDGPWASRVEEMAMEAEKAEELYSRYRETAEGSDDGAISARMYLKAAEVAVRYLDGADEALQLLRRSFSLVPSADAGLHLSVLLRHEEQTEELLDVLEKGASIVDDREQSAYLYLESAVMAKNRGDLDRAEELVRKSLESLPLQQARELLADILAEGEKWEDLISFYEDEIKHTRHPDPGLYLQLGMLWWRQVGDLDTAEQYFQRYRKTDPASPVLLQFYYDYYTSKDDHTRLVALLQQAYRAVQDDEPRALEITRMIARVSEELMELPERAIDQWKKYLKKHKGSQEAISELKRLYEVTGKWTSLVEIYKEEANIVPDEELERKKELMERMAAIYREKLGVPLMAANVYQSILKLDPTDERIIDALAREYESLERWTDLINLYSKYAESSDGEKRKELYLKIARLWLDRLSNPNKATEPLEKVLELEPDNREVMGLLRDIYEKRRNWLGIYGIGLRELQLIPEEERLEPTVELARLAQTRLGKVDIAIDTWNRVLELDPYHQEALEGLAQLYERAKRYAAVVEVLLRLIEKNPNDIQHLEKAAVLFTDRVGASGPKAIELWEKVLDAKPRHPKAIKILKTLYVEQKDWDSLYKLFEEQNNWLAYIDTLLAAADKTSEVSDKVELLFKVADAWKEKVGKPERAIKAYEKILEVDGSNIKAAQELLPIYEAAQKWADLLRVRAILFRLYEDEDERLLELEEMIDIAESHLREAHEAFRWASEAYRIRPFDNDNAERVERLAEACGAWDELDTVYEDVSARLQGEERNRVLLKLARLRMEKLGSLDDAERVLSSILETDSGNLDALDLLASIYEQKEDWEKLLDILGQGARMASGERHLDYLTRQADVYENKLGDDEKALAIHTEILEGNPTHLPSLEAVHRLYERTGRWELLEDIYLREIELVDDPERLVSLQYGLGALYVRLERLEEAVERFSVVLDSEPSHEATVTMLRELLGREDVDSALKMEMSRLLAPYYKAQEEWDEYAQVLEIMAKSSESEDERVGYYRELLDVLKARDTQYAFRVALELVKLRPYDEEVRNTARSLAIIEESLPHLIEIYLEVWERDEELKKVMAWELARIHMDEMDSQEQAEEYLLTVLRIDPLHDEAFSELESMYASSEKWEKLRDLYSTRLDALSDEQARRELLQKLGELCEDKLTDIDGAIDAYSALRDLDPSSNVAFAALQALYDLAERWEDMVELLLDRIDYVEEDEVKAGILNMAASVQFEKLGHPEDALATLESLISFDPLNSEAKEMLRRLMENPETRHSAAQLLAKIYDLEDDFESLVSVLEVQIEGAESDEAVSMLRREAEIYTRELGEVEKAFDCLRRAVLLSPDSEDVVREFSNYAAQLDKFTELVEVYEKVVDGTLEDDERTAITFMMRIAGVYQQELAAPRKAVEWYKKVLPKVEDDIELKSRVVEELIALGQELEEWFDVMDMLRLRLEWVTDPDERRQIFMNIAQIQEELLEAPEEALVTFEEAAEEFPEDVLILDRLADLYGRLEKWDKLVEVLERKAELSQEPEQRRELYARMALIREESRNDIEGAVEAWNRVLDENPDDMEALRRLARLEEKLGEWEQVLEYLDRQLTLEEDGDRKIELRYKMGEILHRQMEELDRAILEYERVIQEDPAHGSTIAALEEIMNSEDEGYALQSAEILEKIYLASEDWAAMCRVYDLRATYAMDPEEKVELLRRVATIYAEQLDDTDRAFEYYGKAFTEALSSPLLKEIFEEYQRLASILNRWGDFVDTCRRGVEDISDPEIQETVLLSIGDVARDILEDMALAEEYYRKALDNEPNNLHALDALERVYEETEKWQELKEIYQQRAEIAYSDPDLRREKLMGAARLVREKLDAKDEAVQIYEEILEFRPEDVEVFKALEELHFDMEAWDSLIALYEHRIQYVDTLDEAVDIRFSMGEIYADFLDEPERALEMFRAALGGDPRRQDTIERLERFLEHEDLKYEAAEYLNPVYAAAQEWTKLIKVLEIQRENTMEPEVRAGLTRRIAGIYEDQLENLEGAFEWYGKLLMEQTDSSQVRLRLVHLAEELDKWAQVADIFEAVLKEGMASEETVSTITETLARIYADRLDDVQKAREHYLQILMNHPERKDIFRELEDLLIRKERWDNLAELYREAADSTYDAEEKNSHLYKLGEILETKLERKEDSIEVYREILDSTPSEERAASALERLYTELERWEDLAELYITLVERTNAPAARAELKLKLSELNRSRLNDIPAALDNIEDILAMDGTNEDAVLLLEEMLDGEEERLRVATMLEPVYGALGDVEKLLKVYEVQVEELDDDVRKIELLRKCVEIHENFDRYNEAFDAMSRAWLLDTSSRDNLDRLHELAIRSERWPDYVRVLEEGVDEIYDVELQAEVYLRIALIHEETLGETDKAIEVLWKLLDVREDHFRAIEILETLLEGKERWKELVELLERKTGVLSEPEAMADAFRKMATVLGDKLGQPEEAIAAWNSVLENMPEDREALEALTSLYELTENWQELADTLGRRLELEEDPERYRELAMRAAAVYTEKLEDSFEAIRVLRALLERIPDDLDAMDRLAALLRGEESWDELVALQDRMLMLVDDDRRNDLLFDTARIVRDELGDSMQAVQKLRTILEFSPDFTEAVRELESMLEEDDQREAAAPVLEWYHSSRDDRTALVALYEKLLEYEDDPERRTELLASIGELHIQRSDAKAAFDAWARLFRERPDYSGVQEKLDMLAGEAEEWQQLAELYLSVLDDIYDDDMRRALFMKVARIYEYSLQDKSRAIRTLQAAKEALPTDREVLRELDRLLTESGRNEELLEVLTAEIEAEEEMAAKAELLRRLGAIRLEVSGDAMGALEAWEEAWQAMSGEESTISLLESLLDTEDRELLERLLDVLAPIYETLGDPARKIHLLRRRLVLTDDDMERASIFESIATVAAESGDMQVALEAWAEALKAQPEDAGYLQKFLHVSETADSVEFAVDEIRKILESPDLDPDAGARIALETSDLALRAGLLEKTEQLYAKGREFQPENPDILRRMERLYRAQERTEELMTVLEARAEIEYDLAEKRVLLVELARLAESTGATDRAIAAWQEVLELDDMDSEARSELARLLEQAEKWAQLVELLDTAVSYEQDPDRARKLRHQKAEILETKMGREDEALDAWRDAYDMDPADETAFEALLRLYEQKGEWDEVKDLYLNRLAMLQDSTEKLAVLRRLAKICDERLGDLDEAADYLRQAFEEDPGDDEIFEQLTDLLRRKEDWYDLADYYEKRAEYFKTIDIKKALDLLSETAGVWIDRLESPDRAAEIYKKILEIDASNVAALAGLAGYYESMENWDECRRYLDQAALLEPTGRDGAVLAFRRARVVLKLGNQEDYERLMWEAIQHDPSYREAAEELEKYLRDRGNSEGLAKLYNRMLPVVKDSDRRLKVLVELAQLYAQLGAPDAARPLVEEASSMAPDDPAVKRLEADVLAASGDHDRAEAAYMALISQLEGNRSQRRELAMVYKKLSDLARLRGDLDKAVEWMTQAQKTDRTNALYVFELGRLEFDKGDYKAAVKHFQSLLFRAASGDIGVSKDELMYHLASAEFELGDMRKAKKYTLDGLDVNSSHEGLIALKAKIESKEG